MQKNATKRSALMARMPVWALAFATTSCYEKLNIAPPNAITNEQVQELLKTADDETIDGVLLRCSRRI